MRIVEKKIENLREFARKHNRSIYFYNDRNDFWIDIYDDTETSSELVKSFKGSFCSKHGQSFNNVIAQAIDFISNDKQLANYKITDLIGDLPSAV